MNDPAAPTTPSPRRLPTAAAPAPQSFLGWLGRQVGFVAKAVKTDVRPSNIVYRQDKVTELPHPADPTLKLRRTVTDEVIDENRTPR